MLYRSTLHQLNLPFTADDLYGEQWEYLLLVSPDRNVSDKVWKLKENFYIGYNHKLAIDTRPHITVALFRASPKIESVLVQRMKGICARQSRFVVDLKDFDGFKPSTIYIKVQNHNPFLELAAKLSAINVCLRENGCGAAYLVNQPHLTVARGVSFPIYVKAMEEFAHRHFQDSFVVNELLLLKRRHRKATCKQVSALRFS